MFTFIFKKEKEKCIIKIIYFNNIKLTLINIYICYICFNMNKNLF